MKETYIKPKLSVIIEIPFGPSVQDDENEPNNGDIIIGGSNTEGDDDAGL